MATSDTLEHDIVRISEDQVAVYNLCTDTTRHMNGIVANMHPSEGVWLFRWTCFFLEAAQALSLKHSSDRGAPRSNCFGSMFGDHGRCGAFPTSSPVVKRQQSIVVQDTAVIVRQHSTAPKRTQYMCFDEAFFKTVENMQWNRDNGCVELIPIVVGLP